MDVIGLDLHQHESQLCILTEDGEVIEHRIRTTRERFAAVLGARPRARILLEASTPSEWVARHLEALTESWSTVLRDLASRGAARAAVPGCRWASRDLGRAHGGVAECGRAAVLAAHDPNAMDAATREPGYPAPGPGAE